MTPVAAVEDPQTDDIPLEPIDGGAQEQEAQQTLFAFEGIKYERNKLSIGGAGDITIEEPMKPGQRVHVEGEGDVVEVKFKDSKGVWVRRHIVYLDEFNATAVEPE